MSHSHTVPSSLPPILPAIQRRIAEARAQGRTPVRVELGDDAWTEVQPYPGGLLHGPHPRLFDVPVVRVREPGWRVVVEEGPPPSAGRA